MNKYLWNFGWHMGRGGSVEGLFVATEKEVEELNGAYINFGEILGKHSEVYGHIEKGDITKLNVSPEAVNEVSDILGDTWSGYDPRDYVQKECPRCEDSMRREDMWYIDNEWIGGCCVTEEEMDAALRGDYE